MGKNGQNLSDKEFDECIANARATRVKRAVFWLDEWFQDCLPEIIAKYMTGSGRIECESVYCGNSRKWIWLLT